ncbi:MAG: hypothetical protein JNK70_00865 [Phycisphaerae bacterium]|nr:hypothetical protein [Phycisphaerae bacterium]
MTNRRVDQGHRLNQPLSGGRRSAASAENPLAASSHVQRSGRAAGRETAE